MAEADVQRAVGAVGEAAQRAAKRTPVVCPECAAEFNVGLETVVPDEQIFSMKLQSKNELLSADTVGGTITSLAKLLGTVAKDVGVPVHVFIKSMEVKPNEVTVGMLIVSNKSARFPKRNRR